MPSTRLKREGHFEYQLARERRDAVGGEEYLHGSFNDFISSVSDTSARISRVFFIISFRGRRLLCFLEKAEAVLKIRRKGGPETLLRERDYPRSLSSGCASISLGARTACTTYQHVL